MSDFSFSGVQGWVSALETEANDSKARAENYRAQATLMREIAFAMSDERVRLECLELAAKWDVLAKRIEDFGH